MFSQKYERNGKPGEDKEHNKYLQLKRDGFKQRTFHMELN